MFSDGHPILIGKRKYIFTQREREVVLRAKEGYSYKEIADERGCSRMNVALAGHNAILKFRRITGTKISSAKQIDFSLVSEKV